MFSTNSWMWQIASYAGIPSWISWKTNKQWVPLHIPEPKPDNLCIDFDDSPTISSVIEFSKKYLT